MPSAKKALHYISSALVTAIAVGLLGYGMSADWAVIKMDCASGGSGIFNGRAEITLGLFNGKLVRDSCPAFGNTDRFEVISELLKATDSVPAILQIVVVCLLILSMVFSAGSLLISLYNSVSNPYENYMGPSGLYAFSSLSACVGLASIIIFALNMTLTSMAESLVDIVTEGIPLDLRNKRTVADVGLYLLIPYIVLSLLAVLFICIYQRAAYKHKRKQQRPTDEKSMDDIMF